MNAYLHFAQFFIPENLEFPEHPGFPISGIRSVHGQHGQYAVP
jgi:hypothetical protein